MVTEVYFLSNSIKPLQRPLKKRHHATPGRTQRNRATRSYAARRVRSNPSRPRRQTKTGRRRSRTPPTGTSPTSLPNQSQAHDRHVVSRKTHASPATQRVCARRCVAGCRGATPSATQKNGNPPIPRKVRKVKFARNSFFTSLQQRLPGF